MNLQAVFVRVVSSFAWITALANIWVGHAGLTNIKLHWYDLHHHLHLQMNTLVLLTIKVRSKKKKTLGAGRNCMQRTKYHHLTSPLRLTSQLPNLAALGNKTYRYIYIYSNSLQKTKLIVIFSTVCGYYNCVTSYPNFMNAVLEKNSWSWSSYLNKLY